MDRTKTSKVYFTSLRTDGDNPLVEKLEKLCMATGLDKIDMNDKLVALKIHFGEPGNLAFLRHNYAARIAQIVKARGGLPYLTDANTLYKGERADAVRHLRAAIGNGYTESTVGCPVIIADGLRGHDHREIKIGLKHFEHAYIASAIAEADVVISLNHFKGHVETGFGGALKNIGMGGGSRQGKNEMHATSAPTIETENCVGCEACVSRCAYEAIKLDSKRKAVIDHSLCVGCGQCIAVCNFDAAQVSWEHGGLELGERIAEYTVAALEKKEHFHINFIMDVSSHCDCMDHNDVPIVPNLGMLASFDPVAVDVASADLVTAAPANAASKMSKLIDLSKGDGTGVDKFAALYPESGWREAMEYAQSIGLGSTSYELIEKEF